MKIVFFAAVLLFVPGCSVGEVGECSPIVEIGECEDKGAFAGVVCAVRLLSGEGTRASSPVMKGTCMCVVTFLNGKHWQVKPGMCGHSEAKPTTEEPWVNKSF